MSMAMITRSGEIAILVTGQYLACGDRGSVVNTKGGSPEDTNQEQEALEK